MASGEPDQRTGRSRERPREAASKFRAAHGLVAHTADAGIWATAPDLAGLFEQSALALGELIAEAGPDGRFDWREVGLEAPDLPGLAYAWLNELIAIVDIHRAAIVATEVTELADAADGRPARLRARVGLRSFGEPGVRVLGQVKSATYHRLRVERAGDGWRLEGFLDL